MKLILYFLLILSLGLNCAKAGINIIPDKDANGKLITRPDAFAAKSSYNFKGVGTSCAVAINTTTVCEYAVTETHVKFNGVNILNTTFGDKANLKILDTAAGTYSSVPNYTLNQFGYNWNLSSTNTKEILPYPADLYQGMRIVVEYVNGPVAKTIYINHYLHKE